MKNTPDKFALLKLRARLLEAQSRLDLICTKILIQEERKALQEDYVISLRKELESAQGPTTLPCITPGEPT